MPRAVRNLDDALTRSRFTALRKVDEVAGRLTRVRTAVPSARGSRYTTEKGLYTTLLRYLDT